MPLRSTEGAVKLILETNLAEPAITPFLETANLLVTEELAPEGPSDERLELIERYLAAHFTCLMDPRVQKEQVGDQRNEFEGKTGEGLRSTRYGTQAITIDPTGILGELDSKGQPFRFSITAGHIVEA